MDIPCRFFRSWAPDAHGEAVMSQTKDRYSDLNWGHIELDTWGIFDARKFEPYHPLTSSNWDYI